MKIGRKFDILMQSTACEPRERDIETATLSQPRVTALPRTTCSPVDKMFRALKWMGSSRKREKFEFHFHFHLTGVPQNGGFDRLLVSVIPVDAGRAAQRTSKAFVKNGSCEWNETLAERVKMYKDKKTNTFTGQQYKFVVSTGSFGRAGTLGEAFLNLVDFVKLSHAAQRSLVLKNCSHGSVLHIRTVCVKLTTPGSKDEAASQGTVDDDVEAFDSAPEDLDSDRSETCSAPSTGAHGRQSLSRRRTSDYDAETGQSSSQSVASTPDCIRRDCNRRSSWEPATPVDDHTEPGAGSPLAVDDGERSRTPYNSLDQIRHGELEVPEDSRLAAARAEWVSWQQKADKFRDEAALLRQQLNYNSASHLAEITALQAAHDALKSEVETLRAENVELGNARSDLTRLDTRNKELQQYVSSVEERYDDLVEMYRTLEESHQKMQQRLDDEEGIKESMEEDMAIAKQGMNHEEQIRELRQQLAKTEKEKRDLEILLKEAEEETARVLSEAQGGCCIEEHGDKIEELQQKAKELEDEATELTYENMEQAARLTRTINDLTQRDSLIAELQASLSRLQGDAKEVIPLKDHQKEVDKLNARVAEMVDEVEMCAQLFENTKAEVEERAERVRCSLETKLQEAKEAQKQAEAIAEGLLNEANTEEKSSLCTELLPEPKQARGGGNGCYLVVGGRDCIPEVVEQEVKVKLGKLDIRKVKITQELCLTEREGRIMVEEREVLLSNMKGASGQLLRSSEELRQLHDKIMQLGSEICMKEGEEDKLKSLLRTKEEGYKELEDPKDDDLERLMEGRKQGEEKVDGCQGEMEMNPETVVESPTVSAPGTTSLNTPNEVANLTKIVCQKDSEIAELGERNMELEQKIAELESSWHESVEELKSKLESERQKAENESRLHADRLLEIQRLTVEKEQLELQVDDARAEATASIHISEAKLSSVGERLHSVRMERDASLAQSHDLEESARDMQLKLLSMKKEREAILAKVAQLENQVEKLENDNEQIQEQLTACKGEVERQKERTASVEEDSRNLLGKVVSLTSDLAAAKCDGEEEKHLAATEIVTLNHKLDLTRKELSERGAREGELEARNREIRSTNCHLSENMLSLERELAVWKERAERFKSELSVLQKVLDAKCERESQQEKDLSLLQSEKMALEERVQASDNALRKAEEERVAALARLQSEVQRLTEQLSSGNCGEESLLSKAKMEISDLSSAKQLLEAQIRSMEEEAMKREADTGNHITRLETRLTSLEEALDVERTVRLKVESNANELEAKYTDAMEREAAMARVLCDLQMEKESLIDRVGDLEDRNIALMEVKDMVENARKELFKKLQETELKAKAANEENSSLAEKLEKAETAFDEMRSAESSWHTAMTDKIQQLEDMLQKRQSDNVRLLQAELSATHDLHRKLDEQSRELERVERENQALLARVNDLPGSELLLPMSEVVELRRTVKVMECELQSKVEAITLLEEKLSQGEHSQSVSVADQSSGGGSKPHHSHQSSADDMNASNELSALKLKIKLLESEMRVTVALMELSQQDMREKERNFLRELHRLQKQNEQLARGELDTDGQSLAEELIRLQNKNAELAQKEKELELRLSAQDILKKEVERARENYKDLKAQSEEELKHLRCKYMNLSIQYAEVEAERERLVQTVKQLRRKK